jgi:hypothetical protein
VEGQKLKDFKGDYEYYLTQNDTEAAKMEVHAGAGRLAADCLPARPPACFWGVAGLAARKRLQHG